MGQLVQEYIRVLPRNIGLTVALDAQLDRIERVDATSAFSGIPVVSSDVVNVFFAVRSSLERAQSQEYQCSAIAHARGSCGQ